MYIPNKEKRKVETESSGSDDSDQDDVEKYNKILNKKSTADKNTES
jgi:hypothetical protein